MEQIKLSFPNHHRPPEEMLSAAAFASPTFSVIHRESNTSPHHEAPIQPTHHTSTNPDDGDTYRSEDVYHDPLNVAAGIWIGAADNFSQPSPVDGVAFEDSRLDSFPLSLYDSATGSLLDHEYRHLLGATSPFLVNEGHSLDAAMSSDLACNMSSEATLNPVTRIAPAMVSSTMQTEVATQPMDAPSYNPGTSRRSKRSNTAAKQLQRHRRHRQPSQAEMNSCTTDRSRRALRVWYKRYNELVEYKRQHGDCNVPQKYKANPVLGIW